MLKINPIGRFAAVLLFFTVMGCIGLAAENVHLEYYKDLYTKKSQEGQPAWLDDYPPRHDMQGMPSRALSPMVRLSACLCPDEPGV